MNSKMCSRCFVNTSRLRLFIYDRFLFNFPNMLSKDIGIIWQKVTGIGATDYISQLRFLRTYQGLRTQTNVISKNVCKFLFFSSFSFKATRKLKDIFDKIPSDILTDYVHIIWQFSTEWHFLEISPVNTSNRTFWVIVKNFFSTKFS